MQHALGGTRASAMTTPQDTNITIIKILRNVIALHVRKAF